MTIILMKIILIICFSLFVIGIAILIVADSNAKEEIGIAIMAIGTLPLIIALICKGFYKIWTM